MKAKIKKTGEIINIASYATVPLESCDSWGNCLNFSFDEVEILQEKTSDIDWEQRRYEIAKEAIGAIMSNDDFYGQVLYENAQLYGRRGIPSAVSNAAVVFADALIAELKKGGNE